MSRNRFHSHRGEGPRTVRHALLHATVGVLAGLAVSGCLSPNPGQAQPRIEWNQVAWPGGTVNVALVRPVDEGTQDHPVIIALPWGSGSADLVRSFVQSYWLPEPAVRGYYVVAPEVRGPSLETTADELIPALFDWMSTELTFDPSRVVLVGASNGGRGLFFAAVAQPARFDALLAMPGLYAGDASDLSVLSGKPIRLLVGQLDDTWVQGTRRTARALDSVGITAEVQVLAGQPHVLSVDPRELLDWIDEALGR